MYHVLLPVGGEESRVDRAATALLAMPGTDELAVTVLTVFEEFTAFDDGSGTISSEELYDPDDLPEPVERVRDRLVEGGLDVSVRSEHGDPAGRILEVVDEADVDQVVMAGRKRTPVGKVLFGSVTQAVILGTDVPVTVV